MLKTLRKVAFTMAEILLSLTIIGVVAAITLPSLTGNINERTWNTQRKALYSRMNQAIALMPSLNGYGVFQKEEKDEDGNVIQAAEDTVAETFLSAGLSKVLKINNICDVSHLQDCGIVSEYITLTGSKVALPTTTDGIDCDFKYKGGGTNAAAFETANGESVVAYYKPDCWSKDKLIPWAFGGNATKSNFICLNLIYDLNNKKGPNTLGKDIGFMTVFYPFDSVVVAPMPLNRDTTAVVHQQTGAACRAMDEESRVPNVEEVMSMSTNKQLILGGAGHIVSWSSTIYNNTYAWFVYDLNVAERSEQKTVRCIKR